VKGDFLIDTGGGMSIHILKQVADRDRLLDGAPTLDEIGRGLGGETSHKVVRGAALSIGGYRLSGPVVAVTEDAAGLRIDQNSIGSIGMEALGRFKLTLDYSRKLLHLEPNRNFRAPFVYDATGLRFRATRPSFSPPYVFSVRDPSPAKEAGIESGDVLLQINGRNAAAMSVEDVREALREPGKAHKLSLSRKGKTIEVILKTHDLLE
jgi:hypothetical protein